MPRVYKRKPGSRTYKSYSENDIKTALAAVEGGTMSICKASKHFNISKGTLMNRIKGRHCKDVGRPRIFSKEEEESFIAHLIKVAEWGFPFDQSDLRYLAKNYLDKKGRSVPEFGPSNLPSTEWAWRFIKQYPELTHRRCQNIKIAKAGLTVEEISQYFVQLKQSVENLTPDCIFNYDETNLSDDPGTKLCIFKRGIKYAERVRDSSKSSTSIMFCGSAAGEVLPPYVVYKSTHLWQTWMEGGPKHTRYNRTASGWFDGTVFTDWFINLFVPSTRHLNKRVALIGDNLSSHFTPEVLKIAEEKDILFICIPTNSTHIAQPLDVAFYAPLKRYWRKILDSWKIKQHTKQSVTKEAFPKLLKELFEKVTEGNTKSENLISGFRKTGIYPFRPDQVIRRMPSNSQPEGTQDNRDVNKIVSNVVVEMLGKLRTPPEKSIKRKRRKIEVTPGKSISFEEIQDGTPVAAVPVPTRRRKTLSSETSESDTDISYMETSDDSNFIGDLSEESDEPPTVSEEESK